MTDLLSSAYEPDGAVIVTGGTGFVGRAIVDALQPTLAHPLLVPVRRHHNLESVRSSRIDRHTAGRPSVVMAIDADDDPAAVVRRLQPYRVRAIVHAAGSCHYTSERELLAGNQRLTQFWLIVGAALRVERFVYISTAFSSGRRSGIIPECLHEDGTGEDLTPYMGSKRASEHLVDASGLSYLILRPSILIGHSVTGEYYGRPYGPYQLWTAAHRWLTAEDVRAASELLTDFGSPPLLHIDMFQQVFLAAWRRLPPKTVMHVVSRAVDRLDSCFADYWKNGPFVSADGDSDRSAEVRRKLWYRHARVNLEISRHRWEFAQRWLDQLSVDLPALPTVTVESFRACQNWFHRHGLASQFESSRDPVSAPSS